MKKLKFSLSCLLTFMLLALTISSAIAENNLKLTTVPIMMFQTVKNVTAQTNIKNGLPTIREKALLYYWNLESGKISCQEKPLFIKETKQSSFSTIIWDGGKSILINAFTFQGGKFNLSSPNPKFVVNKINPPNKESGTVIYNIPSKNTLMTARFIQSSVKPQDKQNYSLGKCNIVVEIKVGAKQKKTTLVPPPMKNSFSPYPLLLFGSPENYTILAAYDLMPKSNLRSVTGKLVLVNVRGVNVQWKEMKGDYPLSFIAGGGANVAKVNNKIYVSTAGIITELDLTKDELVLTESKTINSLMKSLIPHFQKDTESYIEPSLGSYNGILLVEIHRGYKENWIWAIKDNHVLGKAYIDNNRSKIRLSKGSKATQEKLFLPVTEIYLPKSDFGTWN